VLAVRQYGCAPRTHLDPLATAAERPTRRSARLAAHRLAVAAQGRL